MGSLDTELVCPLCEHSLRVVYIEDYEIHNVSKYFLGCSAYPACEFKFDLWKKKVECPECGKILVIRSRNTPPYEKFIGCSGYPSCEYTLDLIDDCDEIQDIIDDVYNELI